MRVCVGAASTNEAVHMEGLNPTVMFAIGQRKGRKVSYNSKHQLTGRDFAAIQYDMVMNRKFNSVKRVPLYVRHRTDVRTDKAYLFGDRCKTSPKPRSEFRSVAAARVGS